MRPVNEQHPDKTNKTVGTHGMRPVNHSHPDETIHPINHSRSDDQIRENESLSNVEPGRVRRAPTIGDIVRGYKSAVTKRVRQIPGNQNVKLWQRNYWEHIIRDEREHFRIREYIENNPTRWEADCFHGDGTYRRAHTNDNELHETPVEYHTEIQDCSESHEINDWTCLR